MLSDPDSAVIRAFGLLNEYYSQGRPGYGFARPMMFVIDAKGVITHRFSDADYRWRPEIDAVLKAIR